MSNKDNTIYFDKLTYYSYTDLAKKRLESREIVIQRNLAIGNKRFVIKHDNKKFFTTSDYKTLGENDTKGFIESNIEKFNALADFFYYNIFNLFAIKKGSDFYLHNIKINNNFFDYEDAFKLLNDYGFQTDKPLYVGKFDEQIIDDYTERLGAIAINATTQTIAEKDEGFFYIKVKKQPEPDKEIIKTYTDKIKEFIDENLTDIGSVLQLEDLLKTKGFYFCNKYNEVEIKAFLIPYLYDGFKVELQKIIEDNKFNVSIFSKLMKSALNEYIDSAIIN